MLSDPQKRAAYDQYGHAGVDPNMAAARARKASAASPRPSATSSATSSARRRRRRAAAAAARRCIAAADLRYAMEITLEEAAHGKDTQIRVPSWDELRDLQRSGRQARHQAEHLHRPATARARCSMRQGFFSIQQTCPNCHGTGKIIPEPCATCHGQGKIKETQDAGSEDSGRHRRRHAHPLAPATASRAPTAARAAICTSRFTSSSTTIFERDGDDLHCTVPIQLHHGGARRRDRSADARAARREIDVPEGTQHGKTFRLRGKGIKGVRSSYRRRPVLPRAGRNAGQAHRAPAQAAQAVREVAHRRRRAA